MRGSAWAGKPFATLAGTHDYQLSLGAQGYNGTPPHHRPSKDFCCGGIILVVLVVVVVVAYRQTKSHSRLQTALSGRELLKFHFSLPTAGPPELILLRTLAPPIRESSPMGQLHATPGLHAPLLLGPGCIPIAVFSN